MKVGIFGGTFNPVHGGHIHMAQQFLRTLHLDRVELMPANVPPHKEAEDLACGADRLAMLRLACDGIPGLCVSDMELKRDGASYTVDTLEDYRRLYPMRQLYLLIGEDMFFSFHQWDRYRKILEMAHLCVAHRAGQERFAEMHRYAQEVLGLSQEAYTIGRFSQVVLSSSEVRARLKSGASVRGLVPDTVIDYIVEKGLYRGVSD